MDNPDTPEDAARAANQVDRTPEEREKFEREMFDKVMAERNGQPREADGKFGKTASRPELKHDKPEAEAKSDKPAATDTPEAREKVILARKALRRDGLTDAQIDELFPGDKLMLMAGIRSPLQDKTDKRFAELQAGRKPDAEDLPATDAEGEQDEPAPAVELPPDVLEYLAPEDQGKLNKAFATHVSQATKAAKVEADKARFELLTERRDGIQRELAATFPSLKGDAPPEFQAKCDQLARGGTYQLATRDGLRELMNDAAKIVFGETLKQEVQKSMIDRNRAALAGQPDPRTLTAPTRKGTVTQDEVNRKAFELKGLPLQEARSELHKWKAGREIKG